MGIEKIPPDQRGDPAHRKEEKRDVSEGAFKKYIEKTGEVDPEEQKRRRHEGEDDSPYRSKVRGSRRESSRRAEDDRKAAPSRKEEKRSKEEPEKAGEKGKKVGKEGEKKGTLAEPKMDAKEEKISPFGLAKPKKKEKLLSPEELAKVEKELLKEGAKKPIEKETGKEIFKETKEEQIKPAEKEIGKAKAEEEVAPLTTKEEKPSIAKKEKELPKVGVKPEEALTPLEKKEKKEAKERRLEPAAPPPIQAPTTPGVAPTAPTKATMSTPQIDALFTHMVSQITIMVNKGSTEIVITLTSETFRNSPFFGSQIVITESPTALRNYNVQLFGATNEARALFEVHAGELLQAFQGKSYPFKIHRVDTGVGHRPLIRRKGLGEEGEGREGR